MATEILGKFKTEVAPSISMNSIANAAGRICDLVDNSTTRARSGLLHVKVKTGTSPTANTLFKFYLIRQSAAASNVKSGGGQLGDVDAAVSAEPLNAVCIGSILVTSTSSTEYSESFVIDEPGEKFSIVVWNATGVTSHATAPTPVLQWEPIVDEAQ